MENLEEKLLPKLFTFLGWIGYFDCRIQSAIFSVRIYTTSSVDKILKKKSERS